MVSPARLIGRNIAAARIKAGYSQEELGVRASLHRTAVGQLERGERMARTDTLVKIAGSLGVRPEQLLAGLSWRPGTMLVGRFGDPDDDARL